MYFRKNSKKLKKLTAFTLAEIVIVLVVIGILTAILLPVAFHSMPNRDVMKFKKGNTTLYKVINELVNSDKYYLDGDLGVRADGTKIDGSHSGDEEYLCQTFADVLSTKSISCGIRKGGDAMLCSDWNYRTGETGEKERADIYCKEYKVNTGSEIKTIDGIIYYEIDTIPFGTNSMDSVFYQTISHIEANNKTYKEVYGIDEADSAYRCKKLLCMDIDGIGTGEDPFGYGIRVDGKIINGNRADAWLAKSISDKD